MAEDESSSDENKSFPSSSTINNDQDWKELSELVNENKLPFFVYSKINDKKSATDNSSEHVDKQIYIYDVFETNCLIAKCYSNYFENYVLHHRPSYTPSESNPISTVANTKSGVKYMFNDIVTIPIEYKGLFEIFSSTSKKAGGILDHEKDVISFASRLKKPSSYYVAKEMKVYEIMVEKKFSLFSSNSKKSYYRKWTHFSPGAICKAIKVVSIDHVGQDQMENNYLCKLNEFFCCMLGGTKKKSDIAIEFKLIENINDINLAEDAFMQDQEVRLKKSKSFYLPVYEENMNKEIDLIPISQLKTNKLETNSLQTINSLIQNGNLKDNCLDLKLFDENPFFKQHFDSNVSEKFGEMVRLNQHLELDKYMSIFELVEIKTKCKLVVGYMLETENLFFTPVESLSAISELKNEINFYSKMNQDQVRNSELINKFQQNELKRFHRIAQDEIRAFNQNLNKLELFALNNKIVNKTELFKPKLKCNQSINHFADFIYLDLLNKISSNSIKTERKNKLIDQLKSTTKSLKWDKYHTLPNKVSNHLIINGINNENKNELKQILDVVELYKANSNHEVIDKNKKERDYLESNSHIELKSVSISSQEVQLRRFKSLPHNNHQRKQNK